MKLGIYLQCTMSVVAENLHEPAVATTREANATFQLAMLAGLVLFTAGDDVEIKTRSSFRPSMPTRPRTASVESGRRRPSCRFGVVGAVRTSQKESCREHSVHNNIE